MHPQPPGSVLILDSSGPEKEIYLISDYRYISVEYTMFDWVLRLILIFVPFQLC